MISIVAEVGSVHDGSLGNALRLIDAASDAGADTVKFQTHIAEAESLPDAPSPGYFSDEPRIAYFRRTGFSLDQWQRLARHAESRSVTFLSSPFSIEAVDLLENVGVKAYKIPSGEVSNLPLLERIAAIGKPVLLSSGMSDWKELDRAVAVLKPACELTVLQCSSAYPCAPEQVGLNMISEMRARYGVAVGFSDHTLGFAAAIAAAALGATIIEKHFTFSRLMYGSDAKHSMEPTDFRVLCACLREVWRMTANPVDKNDTTPYADMKRIFEKSVVTARPLATGTVVTREMLAFKKPGDGISAARYASVLGRSLKRAVPADHKLTEEDLA
jgi:N,N'-diacetyllegionaminate synthase